mmetsp:Transcript_16208/g.29270  ORF Transcript_16208/g.29270 Transcript_16208/m.29270 type:complete len:228 (+) Transcript_16208:305-988(+)|eukprot:CAMPEP_0196136324 /NCGR_PEP_ID=MMETSP0910-20130528/4665_1 /TAXON_ID=49265 /ORGANISM="Thalassiosira rotula, Strain GSO102" /LENGTH=227 /DNA_ID=CAMNT_0041396589 /DNA_START=195 /DNA_END=878 /DNA_ORIENTATION=-
MLQQAAGNDASPEEDIEAPKGKFTTSAYNPNTPSHGPVFLVKAIVGKVVTIFRGSEDNDGAIELSRDFTLGIIFGLFMIANLVILDHTNIIHSDSAHNIRRTGFKLLNDPETLAFVEESSDLKFLPMYLYDNMREEITSQKRNAELQKVVDKRTAEENEKIREKEALKKEFESLVNHPTLELDKYCGGCIWNLATTCNGRVTFLQDKYGMGLYSAKLSAMEIKTCKK